MSKKLLINMLSAVSDYLDTRGQRRSIDQKIRHLKAHNSFQPYDLKKSPPLVAKYDFYRNDDRRWLDFFYSVTNELDPGYIPLRTYYSHIEPVLNDRFLISAIKEKNYYDMHMAGIDMPKALLRRMNGFYYDKDYRLLNSEDLRTVIKSLLSEDRILIKPSIESGSGKGILLFEKSVDQLVSGNTVFDKAFCDLYSDNFVVQEYVEQHDYYRKFNPDSNNTIRVLTYRSIRDDRVNILHVLLRIGAKGSYLDHDNLGGMSIGIQDDSELNSYAFDLWGNKHYSSCGIEFEKTCKAPLVDEIRHLSVKIAQKIFYGRLLALDFTIDSDGRPLLIEINCWKNGISHYQMNNGSLFKEFTEEILDHCSRFHPKRVFLVKSLKSS